MARDPQFGEIWRVHLDEPGSEEQSVPRPCLVVSATPFNQGPAGLVVVLPIDTPHADIPWNVSLTASEGEIGEGHVIRCDRPQSLSKRRLDRRLGRASRSTMSEVDQRLTDLLPPPSLEY